MIEHLPAETDHRIGQPGDISHRVERAGATIKQCGGDFLRAGGLLAGLAGEQFDRCAAAFPLLLATAQIRLALGVVRHVQRAFAAQLAIDVVLVHKAEHQRRRRPEHAVELTADRFAETGFDLVRRDPHAGVDQPDVAPGTAMAGAMGFQHADAFAFFQQMQRRRQPGEPGADHADIDFDFALERGVIRPLRREFFPQTFFA